MVYIKLDARKVFKSRLNAGPFLLTLMLTRDLFSVANLVVYLTRVRNTLLAGNKLSPSVNDTR